MTTFEEVNTIHAVADIGNSRFKAAFFENGKRTRMRLYPASRTAAIHRFFDSLPAGMPLAVSDVSDKPRSFFARLKRKHAQFVELNPRTPLPLEIRYTSRNTLGNDRIANAVGGRLLFPGKPVLVVDAGTCLKVDFVNARGQFLGGSIAPGMSMRYLALHRFTARLPLVRPAPDPARTGTDTRGSMVSGVQEGMLYEMEGAIRAYRMKFRTLKVILTGGDWIYFANRLKNPIFVAPDLTLLGLNEILNFNCSRGA